MRTRNRALEAYLVAAARLGEQRAMERLVELRGPRLLAHAARLLGDVEEARDVAQDAWIEIFRGLGALDDVDAFPAWATQIVTRRVARLIRTKQRQRAIAGAVEVLPPDSDNCADGVAAAEALMLRRAIAALPRDQAATIALFYLEDMGVAEVAQAMDVPPGTVKTRLMHARAKLKEALKGESDEQD
ncbi:MAG: RNA polymerase sigma factor [Pseudomonadota bacterium]